MRATVRIREGLCANGEKEPALWTAQPNSIFISLKGDPNITTWALDEKSHNENSERMDFASSLATNLIKRHYRMGTMFFDSAEAKAIFMVVGMKLIQ